MRKLKNEQESRSDSQVVTTKTFTPFESMGAMSREKHPSTRLSMHSEIMKIYPTLSASSALTSTVVLSQKRTSNYWVIINKKLGYSGRQS